MKPFRPGRLELLLAVAGMALLLACSGGHRTDSRSADENEVIRIAISKAVPEEAYHNYVRWIRYGDSTSVHVDMYHLDYDSAIALLPHCDALLLTGGTDIYPGRYGKEADTARCWKPDFKRDTLESGLLREALRLGMPVMGICRGLQLINVELGGTLYIDLPVDLGTSVVHRVEDSYDARHAVVPVEGSMLRELTGVTVDTANSAHHQGIEVLAEGLTALAHSDDGLAESISLVEPTQFLLGVQWHPERMDYQNPLSGTLARKFLEEAAKYQQTKKP